MIEVNTVELLVKGAYYFSNLFKINFIFHFLCLSQYKIKLNNSDLY